MPSNKYTFNVILSAPETKQLTELAETLKSSRGAVVRRLIDAAHKHAKSEIPTCADGQRCYVPQMHVRPQAPTRPAPQP